jgi:acetate kinase
VTELTVTEPGPLTSTELDAVMDKRISARAYTREQGEAGAAGAVLARDAYLHRLRGSIAAMAAAMDDLDALVFTGGREIGTPGAPVRALVIAAREDIEIARQVQEVLRSG